jgi:hypothetical protein
MGLRNILGGVKKFHEILQQICGGWGEVSRLRIFSGGGYRLSPNPRNNVCIDAHGLKIKGVFAKIPEGVIQAFRTIFSTVCVWGGGSSNFCQNPRGIQNFQEKIARGVLYF